MDNTSFASLQQQLQQANQQIQQLTNQTMQANEEIQRLRASHVSSIPMPSAYPPQHIRPPPRPQFFFPPPPPVVSNQHNNARPSMPQGPPPIPHGFTFGPFNNISQQIPTPGHIPTFASSTIHTTIPPNVGNTSGSIPTKTR